MVKFKPECNNLIKDDKDISMSTAKYPILKFQLLNGNTFKPNRGTPGSSGLDVFSPVDAIIEANGDVLIPLNLRFEIPFGWDLSVYNKSGIATKGKLIKGAELIDSDYRGNCHVHLFNMTGMPYKISKGQKISQLVMREVWMGELEEVEYIDSETQRGSGGFGSTGTQVQTS